MNALRRLFFTGSTALVGGSAGAAGGPGPATGLGAPVASRDRPAR